MLPATERTGAPSRGPGPLRTSRQPSVDSAGRIRLEGDDALKHESIKLCAVLNDPGRVVIVGLRHILALHQDILRHVPASAKLPAVHGDVAPAGRLLIAGDVDVAVHRVVAYSREQVVVQE